MKFNINNEVKVKLTDLGRSRLKARHAELYKVWGDKTPQYTPPVEDENGFSSWALWVLMENFGDLMQSPSIDVPFATEIEIEIYEEPLRIQVLKALDNFDGWVTGDAIAKLLGIDPLDCTILLGYWNNKDMLLHRQGKAKGTTEYQKRKHKCQHPGCGAILWANGVDRHGNPCYRCPYGHKQRTQPTRKPSHHCPKCGKAVMINRTYKDKIYFKRHECLPIEDCGDSQK